MALLCLHRLDRLDQEETAYLARSRTQDEGVETACQLAHDFAQMMRERQGDHLALVRTGARPSQTVRGITGTFGTITRPDGTVQITFNHRALYRYVGDRKPGDTLCQAIEGWYVIRATGHLTGLSGK